VRRPYDAGTECLLQILNDGPNRLARAQRPTPARAAVRAGRVRTAWILSVLVVMDIFTRRIVGFGVESANVDGVSVCRMFNHAITGTNAIRADVLNEWPPQLYNA
jgi:transposase InsO family protein